MSKLTLVQVDVLTNVLDIATATRIGLFDPSTGAYAPYMEQWYTRVRDGTGKEPLEITMDHDDITSILPAGIVTMCHWTDDNVYKAAAVSCWDLPDMPGLWVIAKLDAPWFTQS